MHRGKVSRIGTSPEVFLVLRNDHDVTNDRVVRQIVLTSIPKSL